MFDNLIVNDIFAEKNTPAIIIYLYLFGPKTRTEVYNNVSSNARMPKKIDKLIAARILTDSPGKTLKRPVVALTEMGMQYAHMLCEMEKMAGGNLTRFKWLGVKKTLEEFGYVKTGKATPPDQS